MQAAPPILHRHFQACERKLRSVTAPGHGGLDPGKRLAEILQDRFDYVLGDENTRSVKSNDSYYLLLHVKSPIVIVECGFLSNRAEAALLNTEDYQDRVAWTIHMGIMEYLNTR